MDDNEMRETSLVEGRSIGLGTQIGAFAVVEPGAVIGQDCRIDNHVTVRDSAIVGDRVTIRPGVLVGSNTFIEDDVVIGAHASLADRNGNRSSTIIRRGAALGANVTVLEGVTIGELASIGPGSVVTRDVPRLAIVTGNPASIIGYSGTISGPPDTATEKLSPVPGSQQTRVSGVSLHRLPAAADMRGQLSYAEIGKNIPFEVKRFFLVYGVANQEVRGEHAHRKLHQFLICVHGRCSVVCDDGRNREEFLLDDPTLGLRLPPLVWAIQYKHSSEAVLLVLASDVYDANDYIREYSDFLDALRRHDPGQ
jgi:UDP-2-acetamido-3-amino-2,3-dideoxy-glucuronate N-acetyltransferase